MLNLFCARECIDKEKFIYDNIKASSNESLVIVPNQYTLVAEEQALKYLGVDCLFDTEILSMNRLGHRILAEKGLESVRMISKYGRFMLLTKIINDHKDDLTLFSKSAGKLSFTTMLDDFIVSFKQQNCTIEDLESIIRDDDESNTLLKQKVEEIKGIVSDYETAISGKYTDSEDYIAMYVDAIKDSKLIEGKSIWIYGYDSITPKFTNAMLELSKKADSVSLIINESDYGLDRKVVAAIMSKASESGVDCNVEQITEYEPTFDRVQKSTSNINESLDNKENNKYNNTYIKEKSEAISRIEQGLFKTYRTAAEIAGNNEFEPEGIELVQCANQYYEAENAAAYINHLVRDEGYALRDITVICNNEDTLQPIVKRALTEYGLPVFLDANRLITDSVGAVFIVNLLKSIAFDYSTDSLLALLKTGLTDISNSDIEDLENYVRDYNIRNTMWTRDFKYADYDLDEEARTEALNKLNDLRREIIAPITALRAKAINSKTTGEFVDALLEALEVAFSLRDRNEKAALDQEAKGLFDDAQRTRVSLDEAYKLLDQVKEIMGDYPLDRREFLEVYSSGLTSVEVGVIPPSLDGLTMGTLIRTRPRPSKAVVIIGANEGTLPLQPSPEGLFSIDEKAFFKQKDFPLGDLDDLKMLEENVAIYRMFSHPSERLYISYSMTDIEGSDLIQSQVVDSLQAFFPKLETKKDIVSEGWGTQLVNDKEETLRHLVNHIKDRNTPKDGDVLTRALLSWYRANTPEMLETMLDAAQDENAQNNLGVELTKSLYARGSGDYVLSASRVDKFNSCPFSYYVAYGLSPKEERSFTSDPRSIGDIYHDCLKDIASEMMRRQKAGEDIFTDEELRREIDDKLSEMADNYKGGLFVSTGAERFHLDRIREICFGAAKAIAAQLSSGAVTEMALEEGFGRGLRFKPVEIEVAGERIYIEGRIDRADVLDGGRVRIIDYKTGADKVDVEKMKKGYKMQLMIYLLSATQGEYEPAGLFYFNIKDPEESLNDATEKNEEQVRNSEPGDNFKLSGKFIDEPGVLEMMPKTALQNSTARGALSRDDYSELKAAIEDKLSEIGKELVNGDIKASPLRTDNQRIACTFCEYKAICRYDNENAGNKSRRI